MHIMTYNEAVEYINKPVWNTTRLGLERISELLEKTGSPYKRLKYIHVAGSNGKGSVCAMLSSVLSVQGYRTGFYLSPPINGFTESFQVNGKEITENELCEITEIMKLAADSMEDHPSQFEIKTAIGMMFFERQKCDIVVLEVGLGGEFDSTNVIPAPEVAVITNIGLEHTEYLGNTLGQIAKTKAGIIKTGADVVCYGNVSEVEDAIKNVCTEKKCDIAFARAADVEAVSKSIDFQKFCWKEENMMLELPLLGKHQLKNVAVVLKTITALRKRGWKIDAKSIKEGIGSVKWPARFEVLKKEPLFILDGGHNPQCASAFAETLREYLPGRRFLFIIGVLADKDYTKIIDQIAEFGKRFLCIAPENERALESEKLCEILKKRGLDAESFKSVEDAVRYALSSNEDTVAFGSLYTAGMIRKQCKAAGEINSFCCKNT